MGIIDKISKIWQSNPAQSDNEKTSEIGFRGGSPHIGPSGQKSSMDQFFESILGNTGRQQLYKTYSEIEEGTPEIASILDIYADYCASGGTHDGTNSLRVFSKDAIFDEQLAEADKKIKISAKAWRIFRSMIQNGDSFYELISNDLGIQDLKILPRAQMFRVEDEKGSLLGYQQRTTQSKEPIDFQPWQVAHFRLQYDDEAMYGRSLLWPIKREAHELILMRSGLTITRLSRAHQRLVHSVDVGNTTSEADIEKIVATAQSRNYRQKTMNPKTGKMNLRSNPLRAEEDIWVPTTKDSKAGVEVLQGDKSLQSIEDIKLKISGIISGAKMPESWLGLTGPNVRNVADHQVINFLKTVRRIQRDFVAVIIVVYQIDLLLQGIPWDRVFAAELDIAFPKMSIVEDRLRLEIDKLRAEVAGSLIDMRLYSRLDVLIHVFELTEEDAKKILDAAGSEPMPTSEENEILSKEQREKAISLFLEAVRSDSDRTKSLDNISFLIEEIRNSAEFRGLL